jgi:hypothetical protein
MRGITRKHVNNAVIISSNLTYYNQSYPNSELITVISSNKKKTKEINNLVSIQKSHFYYHIRHMYFLDHMIFRF